MENTIPFVPGTTLSVLSQHYIDFARGIRKTRRKYRQSFVSAPSSATHCVIIGV